MKHRVNLPHVARILLWCYTHVTGRASWAIVGMYGSALARYAQGDEGSGRAEYERARVGLKQAIRKGNYIGLGKRSV